MGSNSLESIYSLFPKNFFVTWWCLELPSSRVGESSEIVPLLLYLINGGRIIGAPLFGEVTNDKF